MMAGDPLDDNRLTSAHQIETAERGDHALRPQNLNDFVGQGQGRDGPYFASWSARPW